MTSFDPDLTSMTVTEEDVAQISACLQRLLVDTGASYSMVVDREGQILAWESDSNRGEMTHLGELLAANYASTQAIAKILKEDSFRTMLQEGMREKIITETVRDQWLLVVIFDHQAHLGLIKVLTNRMTNVLSNILEVALDRSVPDLHPQQKRMLRAARDTIDLIFAEEQSNGDDVDGNE